MISFTSILRCFPLPFALSSINKLLSAFAGSTFPMIKFSDVRGLSGYKAYRTDRDRIVGSEALGHEREPLAASDNNLQKSLSIFDAEKASSKIRERVGALLDEFPDAKSETVISFLLDSRGAMRGWPALLFSAISGVLTRELDDLGIKHEILSFTTNEWKTPAEHLADWRKEREAAGGYCPPARMGSLLHIVWKSVEDRAPNLDLTMFDLMNRKLLKENIDGEAVEWAYSRLIERPEPNKLLFTVKSGGLDPISGATESCNGRNISILHRHLLDTVKAINTEGVVRLSTIILDRYQGPGLFNAQHNIGDEEVIDAFGPIHSSDTREWDDVTNTMLDAICQSLRQSFEVANTATNSL
jgi:hypothetical protein